MSIFSLIALLITLTAFFAYLNYKFIHWPPTVGLMGLSLMFSLALIAAGEIGFPLRSWAAALVSDVNFGATLLEGMLSFLLFAGALNVDLDELKGQKGTVVTLATVGVLVSTVLVGVASWFVFRLVGLEIPLIACLTFGAWISPTDPIAVLALLKAAKAPASLSTKIAGESLFNDGVGIVLFVVLFRLLSSGGKGFDLRETGLLVLTEVGGGLALGLALGWLCFLLLRSVDDYRVEVMLTLALVSGGYELASFLHTSGPLAIVTAGILIGNYGRKLAMSELTRVNVDNFWELLDEILNGILSVLIGLEVLLLKVHPRYVFAAGLAIPVVLAARFASLFLPYGALRLAGQDLQLSLLTWGGLRGGISIALALTLPASRSRDVLLVATYGVVAFSVLVQAPTMPWLLARSLRGSEQRANTD